MRFGGRTRNGGRPRPRSTGDARGPCLLAAILAALLLTSAALAQGANRLVWRERENSVDAQIEGWPLARLLDRLAAKTHWQVFVEPDTEHTVSAKFKGLKPGEALRRLLGPLDFTLLPSTNGPARLFIFRSSLAAATLRIEVSTGSDRDLAPGAAIPNELILTLKPGAKTTIEELAARLKARVVGRADDLRAYRLRFEDEGAAQAARGALAQESDVQDMDANFEVARPDRPEAIPLGGAPTLALRPGAVSDRSRVVVGLIDTAVQFQGTVLKDFTLAPIAVAGQATAPGDQPTHGTAMAETILFGLARSAGSEGSTPVRLLPVDVYGDAPSTTTFEIARGIQSAVNGGASIVNLSLGGEGDSRFLQNLIKAGHDQGVVFVAAAGNEGVATPTYPAAYPEVIAVTASTRSGQVASYANYGEWVDTAAPGTSIVPFQDRSYVVMGTSTATANVSAAAAAASAGGHTGSALETWLRQKFAVPAKPAGP
jgi:hypothetical protein